MPWAPLAAHSHADPPVLLSAAVLASVSRRQSHPGQRHQAACVCLPAGLWRSAGGGSHPGSGPLSGWMTQDERRCLPPTRLARHSRPLPASSSAPATASGVLVSEPVNGSTRRIPSRSRWRHGGSWYRRCPLSPLPVDDVRPGRLLRAPLVPAWSAHATLSLILARSPWRPGPTRADVIRAP